MAKNAIPFQILPMLTLFSFESSTGKNSDIKMTFTEDMTIKNSMPFSMINFHSALKTRN